MIAAIILGTFIFLYYAALILIGGALIFGAIKKVHSFLFAEAAFKQSMKGLE